MFRKAVTLALSVLMVIALVSCSTTTPPDEVVKAFLDHVKAADYEKMAALMVKPDEAPIDVRDFAASAPAGAEIATILEKLTYKVGKPTIDGNHAEVPVEITALDMSAMLAAVVEEYMPLALKMAFEGASEAQIQAEAERVFLEKFRDSDMKLATNNATIPLTKTEGKWLVDFDEESGLEFANAFTGGLGDMVSKLSEILDK